MDLSFVTFWRSD